MSESMLQFDMSNAPQISNLLGSGVYNKKVKYTREPYGAVGKTTKFLYTKKVPESSVEVFPDLVLKYEFDDGSIDWVCSYFPKIFTDENYLFDIKEYKQASSNFVKNSSSITRTVYEKKDPYKTLPKYIVEYKKCGVVIDRVILSCEINPDFVQVSEHPYTPEDQSDSRIY